MDLSNKKVGIWGYGVTGQSVLRHLYSRYPSIQLSVFEKGTLGSMALAELNHLQIKIYQDLEQFLQENEYIIPSPGIDVRPFAHYQSKWIAELDLFQESWQKPFIAITGSVGKTTITHLLSEVLKTQKLDVVTGGNIGIGCLDLLLQKSATAAIIEVSSFQLEHAHSFAPTLAIWTNLHPNHLDRHGTLEEYAAAKAPIFKAQSPTDLALIPWELKNLIEKILPTSRSFNYFAKKEPTPSEREQLKDTEKIFFINNEHLYIYEGKQTRPLLSLEGFPPLSYKDNLLVIIASLYLLKIPYDNVAAALTMQSIPEHRLEEVATINSITFYNDSKATIPASTLAALEKLSGKSIILFVGGISKGVDRKFFIEELKGKVKQVMCFGKEADQLKEWCDAYDISAYSFASLDDAFKKAIATAQRNDYILLSPAGASFDLFTNYQERGEYFKKLVAHYQVSHR